MIDRRPTAAHTAVSGAVISLVVVRCTWCARPYVTVSTPARVEFTCKHRDCKMPNRQDV